MIEGQPPSDISGYAEMTDAVLWGLHAAVRGRDLVEDTGLVRHLLQDATAQVASRTQHSVVINFYLRAVFHLSSPPPRRPPPSTTNEA